MPRTNAFISHARRLSSLAVFIGLIGLIGLTHLPNGLPELLQPTAHAAAAFTVNSTGDGADNNTGDGVCNDGTGNCTLRAAIQQANATPGTDTIAFQIPGSGVRTIAPATALPTITDLTIIDGYTQPGASPNTLAEGDNAVLLVELSGAGAGSPGGVGVNGLTINAGRCVVRGLVINRFSGAGLSLIVAGENSVEGNFIGTNAAGTAKAGNAQGILINSISSLGNANVIGGTQPAARNLISGNSGVGLTVSGSATATQIQGNYIGTDAAGSAKLGNGSHGLFVNTTSNLIGGTAAGARNLISGNGQAGVMLQPTITSAGNTVQGNYIGTDASGTAALGNHFAGVWINFGAGHTVGGSEAAAANVISGNDASGVLITGDLSRNNQIAGNLIGTDASGSRSLGNFLDGVQINDSAHDNFVQQLGPNAPLNTIAFNGRFGIYVLPPGTGNNIRHNNIFSNGARGIEINNDGVVPNDDGDADTGANNSQNYPLVTSVTSGSGTTNIQGTLNSRPNTVYSIDFFANAGCDPSGFGEGARFLAGAGVQTDASGNASFNVTLQQPLPAGRVITATASRSAAPRDTSEFSPCSEAGAAGSVEFSAAYNFIEDIGDAAITVNRVGGSSGALTVNYATTAGTAAAGTDYTAVSGTLTFADGETSKTFAVPVNDDGVTEPDETLGLVLFNATDPEVVGARGRAVMKIVDGSTRPQVTFTSAVTGIKEELSGTSLADYTVGLSAATGRTVSVHLQTTDGTATAGVDYQPVSLDLVFAPGETTKALAVVINGDTLDEPPNETFFVGLTDPVNATVVNGQVQVAIIENDTPGLQFGAASPRVSEGAHAFDVTVVRSGDRSGTLAVDYATADGTASERSDYTTALGRLRFAPGEAVKSFTVLLTDDAFPEGDETINLVLSNPAGGAVLVGPGHATLTVADDDAAPSPSNPIDDAQFFVRQHYHDFLGREPDPSGLQFWTGEIEKCGSDAQCREVRRINVSAAFFLSIEFQRTGVLTYLTHKAAFGPTAAGSDAPVPILYRAFERDSQALQRGYVFGAPGAEAQLEANKRDFFDEFVTRPEFVSRYSGMSNADFVSALLGNAGLSPTVGNLHISRLSASQVVPPTGSPAAGVLILKRNPDGSGRDVTITLSLQNLSSPVTAAHIHGPAAAGANAPALVTLPAGEFNDFQVVLTPEQTRSLVDGRLYVDVHTQNNPEGEIRAQIPQSLFRGDVLRGALDDGTLRRAQVLRIVAESVEFGQAEFRRAFVLTEYFGYLRRDPDAAGYAFWLDKLNTFGGNFVRAEMVKAFIRSDEYVKRFGQ